MTVVLKYLFGFQSSVMASHLFICRREAGGPTCKHRRKSGFSLTPLVCGSELIESVTELIRSGSRRNLPQITAEDVYQSWLTPDSPDRQLSSATLVFRSL